MLLLNRPSRNRFLSLFVGSLQRLRAVATTPYSCTEALWSGYISCVTTITFYDANALYRQALIHGTTSMGPEQTTRPLQV